MRGNKGSFEQFYFKDTEQVEKKNLVTIPSVKWFMVGIN